MRDSAAYVLKDSGTRLYRTGLSGQLGGDTVIAAHYGRATKTLDSEVVNEPQVLQVKTESKYH